MRHDLIDVLRRGVDFDSKLASVRSQILLSNLSLVSPLSAEAIQWCSATYAQILAIETTVNALF